MIGLVARLKALPKLSTLKPDSRGEVENAIQAGGGVWAPLMVWANSRCEMAVKGLASADPNDVSDIAGRQAEIALLLDLARMGEQAQETPAAVTDGFDAVLRQRSMKG